MSDLKGLTADIIASFVSNNSVAVADLALLVRITYAALDALGQPEAEAGPEPQAKLTAAQIRKTITPDAITCLACSKPFKTLRRHLLAEHHWTPRQYIEHFGLPRDYPMVSETTSTMRSEFAKTIGLGRKAALAKPATKAAARKRGAKATISA